MIRLLAVSLNDESERSLLTDAVISAAIAHYLCKILHLAGEAIVYRQAKRYFAYTV